MPQTDRSATDSIKHDIARLRWRCRRGTRELDQLLGGWLENHYPTATQQQRSAFALLLDQQDPEIWHWLMGQAGPNDPDQLAIIDEIRAGHHS
ncbi:MAG: succinate dehydrogenase assembly factor 2 [Dokdonella sp.]